MKTILLFCVIFFSTIVSYSQSFSEKRDQFYNLFNESKTRKCKIMFYHNGNFTEISGRFTGEKKDGYANGNGIFYCKNNNNELPIDGDYYVSGYFENGYMVGNMISFFSMSDLNTEVLNYTSCKNGKAYEVYTVFNRVLYTNDGIETKAAKVRLDNNGWVIDGITYNEDGEVTGYGKRDRNNPYKIVYSTNSYDLSGLGDFVSSAAQFVGFVAVAGITTAVLLSESPEFLFIIIIIR